jgi:P-type Cu+ transporter
MMPSSNFRISGMNCQGCVRQATEAIRALPEVESVVVSLEEASARVCWKPALPVTDKAVIQAIEKAGFSASVIPHSTLPASRSAWSPLEGWRFNVVFGSVALAVLMIGEWGFGLGMEHWFHWLAFALALPVQLICGARFYRGAWMQLRRGQSNMDTLVALGSTTAFAFSAWGLFSAWHGHLYFMEAVGIITLISTGHWLESLAGARAADALRALLNLSPQTARKLANDGSESELPVSELRAGDRVSLRPGDRVPVDGEVVEGASAVDESMLTGESLPVDKLPGAKLYAGTVNADGRLLMRVTATGEATALAQIIAVVQRAQSSRASIQKLGDQVSSVFVPVVVVLAIGTALWWGLAFDTASGVAQSLALYLWPAMIPQTALAAAFIQAAAVLIVACPCAMGLATPAAIMAGTNAAARRGILIRDGEALEKCGNITTVVFDKTGTLTKGKLTVAAFRPGEGIDENEARQLAVALAEPSNHPLSRAVAALGGHRTSSELSGGHRPPLQDWRELCGQGLEAVQASATVSFGSLNWLAECGVNLSATSGFVGEWTGRGATVLGLARDKQLLALLALQDTLKPGASGVVEQLRAAGLKTILLTGDHRATAEAIASQAGIPKENVLAEVRPEQKAEIVKMLQARGERVAFVGDGINDAPALEQADLGIAVAKASDVAREAADIILLKSDIHAIPEALGIAKATLRTIKQNLFWAFFYNAAAVPLAALGFINPLLCAAAMGLSDLVVIGNALRLRRWKP